jgi:AcrR family transcriptional regulator
MRKQRKDAQDTRQRLLAAAAEVFADRGFWEATHAEICEKAKANTAAVNYHFGSKENLYVEAWKYSFGESVKAHPPGGVVAPQAPVQERLYARILSLMQRIADPQTHDIDLVRKEMANPTGLLMEPMRKAIEPIERGFRSIVRELLGDGASEQQVSLCQMSIMTQCFDPMMRSRFAKTMPKVPPGGLPCSIEELAHHITQFSLAGIRGICEGTQKEKRGSEAGLFRNEGDYERSM